MSPAQARARAIFMKIACVGPTGRPATAVSMTVRAPCSAWTGRRSRWAAAGTWGAVMGLCRTHGIALRQGDFALGEAQTADEAFVTGTFGGITPVRALDGRAYPGGVPGPVTARLIALYRELTGT